MMERQGSLSTDHLVSTKPSTSKKMTTEDGQVRSDLFSNAAFLAVLGDTESAQKAMDLLREDQDEDKDKPDSSDSSDSQ